MVSPSALRKGMTIGSLRRLSVSFSCCGRVNRLCSIAGGFVVVIQGRGNTDKRDQRRERIYDYSDLDFATRLRSENCPRQQRAWMLWV
jgi:hypothetical protein